MLYGGDPSFSSSTPSVLTMAGLYSRAVSGGQFVLPRVVDMMNVAFLEGEYGRRGGDIYRHIPRQWRETYNSLLDRDQEIQMPKLAFVRMALACLASFQFYQVIPVQGVVMIILGFMQSHRSCQFAVRFKDNFVLEAPLLLMQLSLDSLLKRVSPRMSQTQRVYVRGLLRESVLWLRSFIRAV